MKHAQQISTRKIFIALIIVLVACLALTLVACNDTTTQTDSFTDGLLFTLQTSTDTYFVSEYVGTDSIVKIPPKYNGLPVTAIGPRAFYECTRLTDVVIPSSITNIGNLAFDGCKRLTNITIPDSVTSIGSNAFSGCNNLIYNRYDNGYYIGNNDNPYAVLMKVKSTDITSCNISNGTKVIYSSALSGCNKLTDITIPDSVTDIGIYAFSGCSGLTSVTIGNSVTNIDTNAFSRCTGLTSIIIPDSVTNIGDWAFSDCRGLTIIAISDSVTSIGGDAFYGCSGLTSITYHGTKAQWKSLRYVDWYGTPRNLVINCTDGDLSRSGEEL